MMGLLRELLDEEGGKAMCEMLLEAASSGARRSVDLNRFEVVVDTESESVEIFDVLEADESERVSLDQFRAAIKEKLSRLVT